MNVWCFSLYNFALTFVLKLTLIKINTLYLVLYLANSIYGTY